MNNDVSSLIEESMNLELNASDLYLLFHESFPDDTEFWWDLALEEKNHAAIFRSGKEVLHQLNKFPQRLLHENLRDLKDINGKLVSMIESFKNTAPSREEAFNIALEIENSATELHFQEFMNEGADTEIDQIFKELNKDDKEHAMRIRSYMEVHGILIQ
ncbi:rubrerythrin family protein [Chloroflexota bacterium]